MQASSCEVPLRVLKFLQKGPGRVSAAAHKNKVLIEAAERGMVCLGRVPFDRLLAEKVLTMSGDGVSLTPKGQRMVCELDAVRSSAAAPRKIGVICVDTDEGPRLAQINLSESPLAQLARLRTKTGAAFLAAREFEAGERLRADYTRGQLMPRLGANWIASVASGKRSGAGSAAELTDVALAARLRVEKAIAAVGPELSGVLIDVCCFLKGMETVEAERAWPVRSGKVVLKTALAALARHYWPGALQSGGKPAQMLHWGTQDYRPSLHARS